MLPTRTPFLIGRNEPCFCGSGKRFRHCCGSSQPDRALPHGIVVEESFLSAEECGEILAVANERTTNRLELVDREKTTRDELVRTYDDKRITERVDMSGHQHLLDDPIKRAIATRVEPTMDCKVEWMEEPHILKYEPGSFYATHADSENLNPDSNLWEKILDRDVSMLLYLDDDYEGGELEFPNFNFKMRPRAGMLVYFPSDSRYRHSALAVTSGTRHAIVTWMSLEGVEKVRTAMPEKASLRL